jgi:hypothetical protein
VIDARGRTCLPNRYLFLWLAAIDAGTLPNGEQLVAAPLSDLFAVYCVLKRKGKLPPRYEPPRPNSETPR